MRPLSNYPPGVSGHEPWITGDDIPDDAYVDIEAELLGDGPPWYACPRCDWHQRGPGECPQCDLPMGEA